MKISIDVVCTQTIDSIGKEVPPIESTTEIPEVKIKNEK